MDKYTDLKNEYNQLLWWIQRQLPEEDCEQEMKTWYQAAVYKIWGSNQQMYSPDYDKVLSAVLDESVTGATVVMAMFFFGGEQFHLSAPNFFAKMVEKDVKGQTTFHTRELLRRINSLLVGSAMINGDFTVAEARSLSDIVSQITHYAIRAGLRGISTPSNWDRVTGRNMASYSSVDGILGAGTKDTPQNDAGGEVAKKPSETRSGSKTVDDLLDGVSIPITLNLTVCKDGITASGGSTSAQNTPAEEAAVVTTPSAKGEETMESLLVELDGLVGLENVKQDVRSLMNFIKVAKIREERGMKVPTISYHLVFTGNPGTGKTSVARLVAGLYHQMGILPKGQLVEADRSSLVGGYLGQTAIKTQKVIQQAMGGVLFIDEAYSLAGEKDDSYGQEALETLLKAMEDHRDELVVIVAGYTDLMHQFIDSNPGLASRFNKYFHFPDYSGKELMAIFQRFCANNGYTLTDDGAGVLQEQLDGLYATRDEKFGNARTARNIFEKAINAQADRLAQQAIIADTDLENLTAEDMMIACRRS